MFQIGDKVERIEDRDITTAVVVDVDVSSDETMYLIHYDEGGEGWWPESSLTAAS